MCSTKQESLNKIVTISTTFFFSLLAATTPCKKTKKAHTIFLPILDQKYHHPHI